MIESRIIREKTFEHRSKQKDAAAFECLFIEINRDQLSSRRTTARALANTFDDRPTIDPADSANFAFRRVFDKIREQRQHFPESRRILARPALNKPEMIEAEHVDKTPSDRADASYLAAGPHLRDHRLTWSRRAGNTNHVQRNVIQQPEIGAALTNRQMFGEMTVRAGR